MGKMSSKEDRVTVLDNRRVKLGLRNPLEALVLLPPVGGRKEDDVGGVEESQLPASLLGIGEIFVYSSAPLSDSWAGLL